MTYLKIGNKIIDTPIINILNQLKKEIKYPYLKSIYQKGDQLAITCPYHKEGMERNPSCFIHIGDDDKYGVFHCFTCGASGTLVELIAHCFGEDVLFASEWLLERFNTVFIKKEEFLPEIIINKKEEIKKLDESILEKYKYTHPYMFKRGLTEDLIRKFKIGCTEDGKFLMFPCWDPKGNFIGILQRSTEGKQFIIPQGLDKPIYLLNYILKDNLTSVVVCEGIFDALIMWKYGYPAVALLGAGTAKDQIETLNKTGIRNYILMYDNDNAGRKGAERFKKFIRKDVLVTDIVMPMNKDCADCTKEEIDFIIKAYS